MSIFSKIISASLSPNTNAEDVTAALVELLRPWTWRHGKSLVQVEEWFKHTYHVDEVFLFQSGRVAFHSLLTSFGIGKGDDVLVQAFTCVAVPNSVSWAGAHPVFVDIDESLNIDVTDAESKISAKTKAIIVQHTFGNPADMNEVLVFARKHHLVVIEDCAHAIGATYEGKLLGTLGDASFFSFGRDKAISSVWGGAAIINARHIVQTSRLKQYYESLPMPRAFWIFQQVLHPVAFSIILPTYVSGIGKFLLVVLQRLGLLSKPVDRSELVGRFPVQYQTRYPNALAALLMIQLGRLSQMIRMRQNTVSYYEHMLPNKSGGIIFRKGSSLLRYPALVDDPQSLRRSARGKGVLLGNWYHNIIDPVGTDFHKIGYTKGSCPQAEAAAKRIINFPTLVSQQQVRAVIAAVR